MRFGCWLWICVGLALVGCRTSHKSKQGQNVLPPEVAKLGATVRSVARVTVPESIPVEGYGLVAGLMGTGSESCPPQILTYLRRFVNSEVPDRPIDVDRLVASKATAVVYLEGRVPRAALRGDRFDVKLTEVSGNAEVSLVGGGLYAAELWPKGQGPSTRTLARVKGASPVFYDTLAPNESQSRVPIVLGGGFVVTPGQAFLSLKDANFRRVNELRNLINARFGPNAAVAQSGANLTLTIPTRYGLQRERFFYVLESLYLEQNQLLLAQRAEVLSRALINDEQRVPIAWHLEGLGEPVLSKLVPLLQQENDSVRLATARCMMNIGGSDGLMALVQMVQFPGFTLKREAVQAIIAAGTSMEMGAFLQSLFQHVDVETARILFDEAALALDIRLMAESLPEVEIAGGLFLHTLPDTPYRLVAVSRRLGARIGLFGGSLSFRPGAYLESPDGAVAVDTRASERFALVTRRLPGSAGIIGPLTCSYRLADIVQVLCGKPDSMDLTRGGCGLPYAELLPLLEQMCSQGMVDAPFHAGPGSEIVQ